MSANLRDVGNAKQRYDEAVSIALYGGKYLKLFSAKDFVEDTISLSGEDWTIQQHRKIDAKARFEDFQVGFKDYFSWKVCSALGFDIDEQSVALPVARKFKTFKIGALYERVKLGKAKINKHSSTSTTQSKLYSLPLVNAKFGDNGIMFYGKEECFDSAAMTIDIIQNGQIATGKVYPQPQKTGVLWDAYLIKARKHVDTERSLIFIACAIEKSIRDRFDRDNKATWERVSKESIVLPVKEDDQLDIKYMESYIGQLQTFRVNALKKFLSDIDGHDHKVSKRNVIEFSEEGDYENRLAAFEDTEK